MRTLIIASEKWIIVTKEHPLMFTDKNFDLTPDLNEAIMFDTEDDAKDNHYNLDETDLFEVIHINCNYEF